jgi:hypothetical protein
MIADHAFVQGARWAREERILGGQAQWEVQRCAATRKESTRGEEAFM